jgi:tetratricopeptide (TPR) repeat protein
MKRILSLCLGLVAFVAVPVMAQAPAAAPTGKIHGHVINPTGAPQGSGNVTCILNGRAASGPGLSAQTEKQGVFEVNAQGEYSGDLPAGTYSLVFRMPETPQDKQVDKIEDVKIVAGQTTEQDIDMSREAYVKALPPDQQKQLEEMRKHNSEAMKANEVIKHLNTDLKTVGDDIHAADGAHAEAVQEAGAGATKQAIDAKEQEIKAAKYGEAEQLMLKDTAAKADASILWARLGQAQVGLKKFDDAITSFKKAIDLESTSKKPQPEVQGLAQAGIGEAYARTGKVEEANAAFDAAAKANPAQATFYLKNQAVIFFQQNNATAQVAAADKAIASNPNPNDPNLAILYYLKGQGLVGSATMGPDPKNPKQQIIILPPGCAEAYQKYLELAPTGPYAADAQGILQQAGQKVSTSYKAGKKS